MEARIVEHLEPSVVGALNRLARAQHAGLHALLIALLETEARRRDGRSSLLIGTGISTRPPEADSAADHVVNLLPLSLTGENAATLAAQIRGAQQALDEALEHAGGTSRFDISLTTNSNHTFGADFAMPPELVSEQLAGVTAGADLAFSHEPIADPGGVELALSWNPDVYNGGTARAWLRAFAARARWLAEDIARADDPAPSLLPEEARCLACWERGPTRRRPAARMHELFERVADRHPERAAVITEAAVQSYAALEQRANRLARWLLDQGVVHEEPIAVLTECSADLPATVLGIWKAGAAYLPLTPEQPPARLLRIAADSAPRILIVLDGHAVPPSVATAFQTIVRPEAWASDAALTPVERPAVAGTAQDLACILYTSGTTGTPKGVLLQHDGVVNSVLGTGETVGLTQDDVISLATTPSFDASLWEVGLGLLHGMAIVPVSRALRDDPWALKQWCGARGVTGAFHVASCLRVSKESAFEGLRILLTGGEAPSAEDARVHADRLALWNVYGPTETTILVTAGRLSPSSDPPAAGRPLPNTRVSIRGEDGNAVPPGVIGEVWLGGTGLARGYLNDPSLTALRFVETAEGRFYRSGDLGRWSEEGELELAGRADEQIKLRGQRVELGEIEQALRSHPAVDASVALVESSADGTKTVRAFVKLRPAAVAPKWDEWRGYLGERLPLFMVPSSVSCVSSFPMTLSGKIDRNTLLLTPRERSSAAKSPPNGDLEVRIATVWKELLGGDVWREDDFFALGGDSLLAVTVAHRLSVELARPVVARELFAAPTLAGFAERMAKRLDSDLPGDATPASPLPRSDRATEGQREFRVAEAAGLDTSPFTIPLLRLVEGALPPPHSWNAAWARLVERHESLRTYFSEDAEGRLYRCTVRTLTPTLESALERDLASARAFVRRRQAEPFVMGVPPLWRAGLVEVADSGEHLFWLALHHSVGDGRSIGILCEELAALLRGEELPPLGSDFAEFAAREEAYLAGPACAEDARYWRELLASQPASAFEEAPLDFPRASAAKAGNHRFETRLDPATTRGLKSLAREHEASLHAVMLTLLAIEARRRTGRAEMLLGTAASLRETSAETQIIGDYVNMLPIPCRAPRESAFSAVLRQTQHALAAGLQRARYPFARIYHDFWSERPEQRDPARYPLFDLAVTENPASPRTPASLRLSRVSAFAADDAGAIDYEYTDTSPGQDMVLSHEGLADGSLLLQWHVNAALYTRETASRWFEALCDWAVWLTEDDARARTPLPGLLAREAAALEGWEQGANVARPPLRFNELFERVLDGAGADQRSRAAVVTRDSLTTYGALEREANAIAHFLLLQGVASGAVVGVLSERSAALPAAVLAIWKAGATYLPLAADLPPERLSFMARDAGATLLLALDGLAVPPALARHLPAAPCRPEQLDDRFCAAHAHRPEPRGGAGDAAYIIYTSGSTGQPKGTVIGHDAYVNAILGTGEAIGMTPRDRSLMFASPSFDASLSDLGMPLAFGAALCPVPREVLDSPKRFRALLAELDVTVADLTPTYLRLFDGAALPSLRILITGGEPPFLADVQAYAARHQYFDAYGPSENAITTTLRRLRADEHGVVGGARPLPNVSVELCDPQGSRVPPGVVGELWLGGAGLGRGYLGQPALTAAAFVETARGRRYRSGDLGRWHTAGKLELLGRIDDQVKLNGVRIELGEIEHSLTTHPAIAQAVTLLHGDEGRSQSLWAFVRAAAGMEAPTEESLRDYLADRLPTYMIPSAVRVVSEVPLTTSGKVDKVALRALLADRSRSSGEGCPPEPGLEVEIARAWSDLLGRGPIQRDDNFFALGGHSLLAIALAHRLEETLCQPVPARALFAEPTLRGFAERIRQLGAEARCPVIASNRATEGQREFWVAEQAGLDTSSFNIALTLHASGRVPAEARWRQAWAALVTRHAALRTSFREDQDGVLRRDTALELRDTWESSTQPDLPSALALVCKRQSAPFAMASPPLWRTGLVRVMGSDQAVFWLALHHSVGDGASLGILVEELRTLLSGRAPAASTGHFDRLAGREEAYLAGPDCQYDALYWRKTLGGLGDGVPTTPQPFDEWPLDFPRPLARTAQNAKGAHLFRARLDTCIAAGLRDFAQRSGASLHAVVMAIMAHEVRRRTGRPEFVLGTAVSSRESRSEARIVGYCVNALPVPCRLHGGESIEQTVRSMQRNLAEGLEHARYPFAHICRDFLDDHALTAHRSHSSLVDLAVTDNGGTLLDDVVDDADDHALHLDGIAPLAVDEVRYEFRLSAPAQDMVLAHEGRRDGGVLLTLSVNAALYEKETAQAWIDSLLGWARFLAEEKRLAESPLPALLPHEAARLSGFEQGAVLAHPAPTLPAQFEEWARVHPEQPALITDQGVLSYAELNARANALGHALLSAGVMRGESVGVFTDRSSGLPEIALAIWKIGACYVPLVSELPPQRSSFILRDAGIRVLAILDGHELPAALAEAGCRIVRPESLEPAFFASHRHPPRAPEDAVRPLELAYIIYTSGSTGLPKGVMLRHQGLNNLGLGTAAALALRSDDRVSLLASPAFDAWLAELSTAWAVGAAVVPIVRSELDDIHGMRDKLTRLGVSAAIMTPGYLRLFERADFPSLRALMTVGESPDRADALHYAARLRYYNGYGPTENTAAASYGQVEAEARRLTAGKPLANTSVHIRNSQGEPVPPGAVGLIWLGGIGLAVGYLNRPELTAASFVETATGRSYCTGDWGRWTHAGELEILGRSDGQVKVRGHRVELGEIEHRLGAHPSVRQAVAAVETQADGTQNLWAFVCLHSQSAEPTQAEWRDHLSSTLPSYMLPSAVLSVSSIALSTSGKVDRTALLRAVSEQREQLAEAQALELPRTQPRDGTEARIARVWAECLERPSIAREDDFFELGGNSLRVISVINRLRRQFYCTINDLYERPRLADFAAACQPRPEHLKMLLRSVAQHWRGQQRELVAYEAARDAALSVAWRDYESRNRAYCLAGVGERRDYGQVLLTGATGYLGSYLLRELLLDADRRVTALVRGADDRAARARLGETLCHYFGPAGGAALRDEPRLTVLAGDLRRDDLGLSAHARAALADSVRAIFHAAANVKHFGHYREFQADNVDATERLLKLASQRAASPADFHFVSTLSASGSAPEVGFRLFTEYDTVPEQLDENYYVRSKQRAEQLVVAARDHLANACIHRIGSVVFAAEGGPLQANIKDSALFRQLAAFLRLRAVPDDSHLWLCHVDIVARGLVLLAGATELTNETHHLENARRDTLASFVSPVAGVRACGFDAWLERLEAAVDEPEMDAALNETLENFRLYSGVSPQARARRLEIVSERTQRLLAAMGVVWPAIPAAGQAEMLREAAQLFSAPSSMRAVKPSNSLDSVVVGQLSEGHA